MTTTVTAAADSSTRLPVPDLGADPTLVEDARQLSDAVGQLIRVVQFRDRDRACCYDISVSQCYALKGVVDAGALTTNDLAAHLYLDKSTTSRIVTGLVDKGLLVRERDGEDGRVVHLVATADGTTVCAKIETDLAGEYAELLVDFSPEVRAAITRLMSRVARSFAARVETSGGSCCVVT